MRAREKKCKIVLTDKTRREETDHKTKKISLSQNSRVAALHGGAKAEDTPLQIDGHITRW